MEFPFTKKMLKSLKSKKVTAAFTIISFLGGLFFINKNITGNAVLNYTQTVSYLSLIGIALILCSIILGIYTIKH